MVVAWGAPIDRDAERVLSVLDRHVVAGSLAHDDHLDALGVEAEVAERGETRGCGAQRRDGEPGEEEDGVGGL